jgi:GNAT superfamily N-acetyltransferase
MIRAITSPKLASEACLKLTNLLPDWFGRPEANTAYIAGVADCICYGAFDGADDCVGLVALRSHFGSTLEIWWMAVAPDRHRTGIGAKLMAAAQAEAIRLGCTNLILMTLGEESDDAGYAATRRFYLAQGFRSFLRDHMVDPETPLVWMIRPTEGGAAR